MASSVVANAVSSLMPSTHGRRIPLTCSGGCHLHEPPRGAPTFLLAWWAELANADKNVGAPRARFMAAMRERRIVGGRGVWARDSSPLPLQPKPRAGKTAPSIAPAFLRASDFGLRISFGFRISDFTSPPPPKAPARAARPHFSPSVSAHERPPSVQPTAPRPATGRADRPSFRPPTPRRCPDIRG